MPFGPARGTTRADVEFRANTAQFKGELSDVAQTFRRTTGGMSSEALNLAKAQDRLNRELDKAGGKTTRGVIAAEIELRRAMDATTRSTDRQERELGQLARGAAVGSGALHGLGRSVAFASSTFLGTAGLVYGIRSALDASSHLNEMTSRTRVTFGAAADEVIRFSNDALGLSRDQALEAASGFGGLLRPLGILPAEAARLSVELSKLGVDLSSFADTPVPEALDAIRSGLVGESEPLRRYNVLLSEARVQHEAFRQTGKSSAAELTDREKVLARLSLILKGTTQAQGDYLRTLDGTANQEREASAGFRDTAAAIGQALDPSYNKLLHRVNEYLGSAENQQRIQDEVNKVVDTGTQVAHGLAEGLEDLHAIAAPLVDVVGGLENAVHLLLIAMAVGRVRAFAGSLGLVGPAAAAATAEVAAAETAVAATGVAAGVSATRAAALRSALLGLGGLTAITIGIDLVINRDEVSGWLEQHGLGSLSGVTEKGLIDLIPGANTSLLDLFGGGRGSSLRPSPVVYPPPAPSPVTYPNRVPGQISGSSIFARPLTAAQQRAADLARFAGTGSPAEVAALRAQSDYDRRALAFLEQQKRAGKVTNERYVDAYSNLWGDLIARERAIASIAEQKAQDARAAREKREAARLELIDALIPNMVRGSAVVPGAFEGLQARAAGLIPGRVSGTATVPGSVLADFTQGRLDLELARIDNRVLAATLTKTLADDRKANDHLIAFWRRRTQEARRGSIEREQARAQWLQALVAKKGLTAETAAGGGAAANQRQFLESFQQIQSAFAPNAFPIGSVGGGKSETHLYEAVHELRQQTQVLQRLAGHEAFPATRHAVSSALAAFG